MNYSETIDYLYSLQWRGVKVGLENMQRLMELLGHPHRSFPSIHIAGTNGKGSTAAIMASILQTQGFRVGLYTSPHLVDFNERIRIGERVIPDEDLVTLTGEIREALSEDSPACQTGGLDLLPTFFELTTALAFLYFAREGVDMAVVEVGMGGRFDATNLLVPRVSVITQIERDHCAHLGEKLGQIAYEKAGIVKSGVPVVTAEWKEEPLEVIRGRVEAMGSRLIRVGETVRTVGSDPVDFSYQGLSLSLEHLTCALRGTHQIQNAATALAALEVLREQGLSLDERAIRSGLRRVRWEGRLQVVEEEPLLILDGAHNPAAARVLARALERLRVGRGRLILLLGILRDKEIPLIFEELVPLAQEVILTRPDYERAAPLSLLEEALQPYGVSSRSSPRVPDALELARSLATPRDLICVTGSLYTVGEVKAYLEGRVPSLLKG